jgi:hypothetical protein
MESGCIGVPPIISKTRCRVRRICVEVRRACSYQRDHCAWYNNRLFLGRARRGQGSLQPTCGPQLAKGCARRNGHAYSCRAAHDLVDCHCCRDCRDRSAARKPLKCRGLGAGPRQPGPAAMLRPVQYVAAAPAGFRKRFSMKNSIMRSVLIPLWPRSGPTWRSKLFPARCSSLMSCIMFDGCTLLSAVP